MVPLPFDLDRGHSAIEAGQCVAQRCTRRRDKASMQRLCNRGKSLDGLVRVAPLPQQGLELIHGVGITGPKVMALQCLQRDSPLAEVVWAIPSFFQSGDAPSRGPRSIQGSMGQKDLIFIHQYMIYTHLQHTKHQS
jgi:hypothetical protein